MGDAHAALSILWRLKQSLKVSANLPIEPIITQIGLKRWKMHKILLKPIKLNDMDTTLKKYMPDYVELYYVDYQDDLSNNMGIVQKCLEKNNLYPLEESVYDWWDFPEGQYLDEIHKNMKNDGLEDLFDENRDEIMEYLWDHDESTPVKDLLKNTGEVTCFYSFGVDVCGYIDSWCGSAREESEDMTAYKIRKLLGIKKDTKEVEKISEMVSQAYSGGDLRVYFNADIDDLISGDAYAEEKQDFQSIRLDGLVSIGIIDTHNGSGDFCEIEVHKSFPFNRENLFISSIEKWGLEDIFGGDVIDTENVSFSMESAKGKKAETSKTKARMAMEEQYKETFRKGGCTAGDMDIRRHRDVYYDNGFPAGDRCPHCGTFWVD